MDPREQAMKAWLDGKFVKFTGKYEEGRWPFKIERVSRDFNPFMGVAKPAIPMWLQRAQNRKWTVITDAEVEIVRKRYREGRSQTSIAVELGRHWTTLKPVYDQVAAEIGPVKKNFSRGRKFEWTEEQRSRLLELRSSGLCWRQIGKQLGCNHDSASREHFALTGERRIMPGKNFSNPLRWDDADDRRLLELRALGLTRVEIGRRMGRSHHSIGARIARLSGKAWTKRNLIPLCEHI